MDGDRVASRRRVLRAGGALLAATGLAGCAGDSGGDVAVVTETDRPTADGDGVGETAGTSRGTGTGSDDNGGAAPGDDTPVPPEEDPGEVYVPDHFHPIRVVDTATAGDYALALAYSIPDFYYRVDGRNTEVVTVGGEDTIQVLVYAWAADGSVPVPGVDVEVAFRLDGETVATESLVPMLNQRTGLHHARNVALSTYGEYEARVGLSAPTERAAGGFDGAFGSAAEATLALPFERGQVEEITTTYLDQSGDRGAVAAMGREDLVVGVHPGRDALPGSVAARTRSGAAALTVSTLPAAANPLGEDRPYLALSMTTPFNRYPLPRAAVSARLERDGSTAFEGPLRPTVAPDLGYHYGAGVDAAGTGDRLTLSVGSPPQIARFVGYERAFLTMPDRTVTLG